MELLAKEKDFYTNIVRALDEIDKKWRKYNGLIIGGTHEPEDNEEKIKAIQKARENNVPFLGICAGMQLMCVESARHVLNIKNADSREVNMRTQNPIIVKMPELRVGIKRVNGRLESHWHNYTFNNNYLDLFKAFGYEFVMTDNIVEEIKYPRHPYFVGVQYHPEYQSIKGDPHQILKDFLYAAKLAM